MVIVCNITEIVDGFDESSFSGLVILKFDLSEFKREWVEKI